MPRIYSIPFDNVAQTVAVDIWEFTPADDKSIEIRELKLYQYSDLGDAAQEIIRCGLYRGFTTSGSGGTTPTPAPYHSSIDAAAGFTVEMNNTTQATTSGTLIDVWYWNIATGLEWVFPADPDESPAASQANTTLIFRTLAAPADSLSMGGCAKVKEHY